MTSRDSQSQTLSHLNIDIYDILYVACTATQLVEGLARLNKPSFSRVTLALHLFSFCSCEHTLAKHGSPNRADLRLF